MCASTSGISAAGVTVRLEPIARQRSAFSPSSVAFSSSSSEENHNEKKDILIGSHTIWKIFAKIYNDVSQWSSTNGIITFSP